MESGFCSIRTHAVEYDYLVQFKFLSDSLQLAIQDLLLQNSMAKHFHFLQLNQNRLQSVTSQTLLTSDKSFYML